MCGTRICDPTESGDFTLAMCNDAPCDSTTVHTVTVCGKTKCSSGEVPSETFTLCGTELCPVDLNNTDDRSGSKTNGIIVTLPSFIPSATVDVTVTDSVDSGSNSSASSISPGVNSDSDFSSDTSNNPIEESSDSLNTAISGESNTNSDDASNSESNSSSNSNDVISDSILDESSAVRSIGSQSINSTSDVETCVGVDCPTSITMCGTSICSPGETNGNFILTMCRQRPCGNGGLYTVTICPDNSVCSDEGGQIYTMCGTGICPEPPVFTTIAPFWWHHHDHHHRSHTNFENTEHYHQVHGDRVFPWTEGINVDWINWDTTTTST
ncbi:hypothetical protein G6F42_015600 [Rhizopus arrhizus]|nr:hypothetical protein G6F42_015600 [Rhizopus arrhizus]